MIENNKIKNNLLLLSDLMEVCTKLSNIRPVILFGSLLGIIRDGDLISWNNDIELGVSQFDWNEVELEKVCNEMRLKGYLVNYYMLNKAISIRSNNNIGEVHINYFKELNGYCYRPLEPSDQRFANPISFLVYWLAMLLNSDLDNNNQINIKSFFYRFNLLIPKKIRLFLSYIFINLSLSLTECRGTYRFPFQLKELTPTDLHGIKIYIPKNSKLVVREIYGEDWHIPKEGWSYYDPENVNVTKVKKLTDKWDYKYAK